MRSNSTLPERTCLRCQQPYYPGHGLQRYCSPHCRSRTPTRRKTPEERFWAKVDRSGECWLWQASLSHRGYGATRHSGRTINAHRLAWIFTHGTVPEGLSVLHRCDNRRCCNPAHLFLGTPKDNTQDAIRKGRLCCGEAINFAKLTPEKVRQMRELHRSGVNASEVGRRFAVTPSVALRAIKGQTWKSVR